MKSKHVVEKEWSKKKKRINLSVASNLMLLFYKSMACAVYSREIIFLTVISHVVNQYKSIKSIDDNLY